ncbi:MAG TPA: SDR family oxidoreductase [Candidatus Lokiarchaeia archaeon]|nr:SDR family oxidoreductase [Candidatus Lokiarchaeia archaeon]
MKIAILGGSGRTGLLVIKEGLERGHELFALVRKPGKIDVQSEHLHLIEGVPTSLDNVRETLKGTEAVVIALNINRKSDLPWAKLTSPEDLISASVKNAIRVMQEEGITRIVSISAYGVGDTRASINSLGRLFLFHTNIKYAYVDHERQEKLISASDLDWIILRPTFLKSGEAVKEIRVSINGQPKPRGSISRRNLARFILNCVETGNYSRQFLTLSEP